MCRIITNSRSEVLKTIFVQVKKAAIPPIRSDW